MKEMESEMKTKRARVPHGARSNYQMDGGGKRDQVPFQLYLTAVSKPRERRGRVSEHKTTDVIQLCTTTK